MTDVNIWKDAIKSSFTFKIGPKIKKVLITSDFRLYFSIAYK